MTRAVVWHPLLRPRWRSTAVRRRAAGEEQITIVNKIDNGRGDKASDTQAKPFYLSGRFVVSRGVIVKPEEIKEEG